MPSISIAGQQAARDHVWSLLMRGFSVNGVTVPRRWSDGDFEISYAPWIIDPSEPKEVMSPADPANGESSHSGIPMTVAAPEPAPSDAATSQPVSVSYKLDAASPFSYTLIRWHCTSCWGSIFPGVEHGQAQGCQYPSPEIFAFTYTQQAAPTDAATFYASMLALAREIATFSHDRLQSWSERVAPYLDKVRAECIASKRAGYMLAATKVDSAVADLICAHGQWERDVAEAVEAIKREAGKP